MDTFAVVEPTGRRHRRRYSAEFKAGVVRACQQAGVSIAAVALANGLNANMLRKWVIEAERGGHASAPASASTTEGFVQLAVPGATTRSAAPATVAPSAPAPAATAAAGIFIELQRPDTSIYVTWPASAASECAAWLRELLK